MKKGIILLSILLIINIVSVSALDVSDLSFFEVQNHEKPLVKVSYGLVPSAVLKLVINGDDFASAEADIQDLNRQYYSPAWRAATDCEQEGTQNTCYVRNIPILLDDGDVIVPIKLTSTSGDVVEVEKQYVFQIDNVQPVPSFIGRPGCTENCFIGNNVFTDLQVQFEKAGGSFENGVVVISLNGNNLYGPDCEGLVCNFRGRTPCADGQGVSVTLDSTRTKDDSYNSVDGTITRTLTCDAIPPVIEEELFITTDASEFIRGGDTFDLVVTVDELHSPYIEADFTDLNQDIKTGTCTREGSKWKCKVTARADVEGPYNALVSYRVYDAGGNYDEVVDKPLQIYGIDDAEEPNYWTVGSVEVSPERISKNSIEFTSRKAYVKLDLNPRTSDVEIIDFKDVSCEPVDHEIRIGDIDILNDFDGQEDAFLVADLRQNKYEGMSSVKYNCEINFLTRRDVYVTSQLESENFFIEVDFTEDKGLQERVLEEVRNTERRSEKRAESIQKINERTRLFQVACNGMLGIKTVQGTLGAAEMAATPLYAVGLGSVPDGLMYATQGLGTITDYAAVSFIYPVCEWMSCRSSVQNKIKEFATGSFLGEGYNDALDKAASLAGYNEFGQVLDPQNNIVWAFGTLCLPGILNNLNRLNVIDCQYTQCLSKDVNELQIPVSQCVSQKGYSKCKLIYGSVFGVLPVTALLKAVGHTAKQILTDPVTFLTTAGLTVACPAFPNNAFVHGSCSVATVVTGVPALWEMITGITEPAIDPKATDYCSRVSERVSDDGFWIADPHTPELFDFTWDVSGATCTYSRGCQYSNGMTIKVLDTLNNNVGGVIPPENIMIYQNGEYKGTYESVLNDFESIKPNFNREEFMANLDRTKEGWSYFGINIDPGVEDFLNDPKIIALHQMGMLKIDGEDINIEEIRLKALIEQIQFAEKSYYDKMIEVVEEYPEIQTAWDTYQSETTELNREIIESNREIMQLDQNIISLRQFNELRESMEDINFQLSLVEPDLETINQLKADKDNVALAEFLNNLDYDPEARQAELVNERSKIQNQFDRASSIVSENGFDPEFITDNELTDLIADTVDDRDNKKEEVEDMNKDLEREGRKLASEMIYQANWGTASRAYMSGIAFGRAMSMVGPKLSNLISSDFAQGWEDTVLGILESDVANFLFNTEDAICEGKLEVEDSPNTISVNSGSIGRRAVAHIEGIRTKFYSSNGESYEYLISGGINPGEGIEFQIFLEGDGVLDITPGDDSFITVENTPVSFAGTSLIRVENEKEYSRVCIKFLNSNMQDYFEGFSGEKLCSRLIEE